MSGFVGDKSTNLKAGGGTTTNNAGTTTDAGTIQLSEGEERVLKSVGYSIIVDDYIKQIVRESAIMQTLQYNKKNDNDNKLTTIILSNFYSSKFIHGIGYFHLRLNANSNPTKESNGYYNNSLLDGNGHRISGSTNIQAIKTTHADDNKNIANRDFSEWVI